MSFLNTIARQFVSPRRKQVVSAAEAEQLHDRLLLAVVMDSPDSASDSTPNEDDLTPQGFAIADLGVQQGPVLRGLTTDTLGVSSEDSSDSKSDPTVLRGFADSPIGPLGIGPSGEDVSENPTVNRGLVGSPIGFHALDAAFADDSLIAATESELVLTTGFRTLAPAVSGSSDDSEESENSAQQSDDPTVLRGLVTSPLGVDGDDPTVLRGLSSSPLG